MPNFQVHNDGDHQKGLVLRIYFNYFTDKNNINYLHLRKKKKNTIGFVQKKVYLMKKCNLASLLVPEQDVYLASF